MSDQANSTDEEAVRYEVADAIATITLNEPHKLNPMSPAIQVGTIAAFERAGSDGEVRVVILTGEGRAFSAGGDVRGLGDGADAPAEKPTAHQRRAWLKRTQKMVLAVRECEKPVLAAVNGVAAGGGLDMALACDIRFASDKARFSEIFARIGLFPGTGGTYFLPRIVGVAKALELIWTGDMIDAAEALAIGLVSRVIPHDDLLKETRAFATKLAAGPPMAQSLAKAAVYRGLDLDMAAAFDYAATAEGMTLTSQDHAEGVRALQEKRTPTFRGR